MHSVENFIIAERRRENYNFIHDEIRICKRLYNKNDNNWIDVKNWPGATVAVSTEQTAVITDCEMCSLFELRNCWYLLLLLMMMMTTMKTSWWIETHGENRLHLPDLCIQRIAK